MLGGDNIGQKKWGERLGGCIVLNMYEYTWVHGRGIDLDLAVLSIHMVYMLYML